MRDLSDLERAIIGMAIETMTVGNEQARAQLEVAKHGRPAHPGTHPCFFIDLPAGVAAIPPGSPDPLTLYVSPDEFTVGEIELFIKDGLLDSLDWTENPLTDDGPEVTEFPALNRISGVPMFRDRPPLAPSSVNRSRSGRGPKLSRSEKRHAAVRLLWVAPLAFIAATPAGLLARWGWCGETPRGCYGALGGVMAVSMTQTVALICLSGIVAGAVMFLTPWIGSKKARGVVATAVTAAVIVAELSLMGHYGANWSP